MCRESESGVGRRAARQKNDDENKRQGWPNLGTFPNRRIKQEEKSRNDKKTTKKNVEVLREVCRPKKTVFCLSASYVPTHRSSRGRNGDRSRAVSGYALKRLKKKVLSMQAKSYDEIRTCERHAGQLLRPVSSHRSTQSLWNTCRHDSNLSSSSGS